MALFLVCAILVSTAHCHGTLTKPVARNRGPLSSPGPSDYQSGNGGGKGFSANYNGGQGSSPCGDGIWGFSNNQGGGGVGWHYRGGDAKGASLHNSFKALLKEYTPGLAEDYKQNYVQGENIAVQAQITAYHGGHMIFHLCPVQAGELDFDVDECGLLADPNSEEYQKHLLTNLTPNTLPPPSQFCTNCDVDETAAGFCGYNPGCLGSGPDGYAVLDITLEASQVAMDHGVLVWHWFTNNNGAGFVGGEEFMNCADVRVLPSGASGGGATLPPSPSDPVTSAPTTTAPPPAVSTTTTTTTTAVPGTSAPSGSEGCVANLGKAAGVSDADCKVCASGNYEWWPCNGDLCICESSTGATTVTPGTSTTTTIPTTTTATTTTTTTASVVTVTTAPTAPSGLICKADLSKNAGATDESCTQCAGGYQWWPCNAELCICSTALVQEAPQNRKKKGRKHAFLGRDHLMLQAAMKAARGKSRAKRAPGHSDVDRVGFNEL